MMMMAGRNKKSVHAETSMEMSENLSTRAFLTHGPSIQPCLIWSSPPDLLPPPSRPQNSLRQSDHIVQLQSNLDMGILSAT